MARYKKYDYNQMMMVPVSLTDQLMPGTLEYAIHRLIEDRLDTSSFDAVYANDERGRSAYDPKVLLKVVLFAASASCGRSACVTLIASKVARSITSLMIAPGA